LSIAREAGVELPLEEFDRLGRETPQLASMNPGGKHFMEDLDGRRPMVDAMRPLCECFQPWPA
jgi:dihydroxy-acid dehydratase